MPARIIAKDGTELHVTDWGQGRPVVLIHGWPLDADAWDVQQLALAEAGYRAIAYDRRGFGRSGKPFAGYDYDTFADDLAAVMQGLSLEDATLVGFSMGGGEIARYASRHGGAGVRKAVLVASVVPGMRKSADNPDGADPAQFEGIIEAIRKDRAKFLQEFFPSFYGRQASEAQVQRSVDTALKASLPATIDCVRAFGLTDFTGDMAALGRLEVLVIHGTGDSTVPIGPTAHRLVRMIPSAGLIEYDGAPHGLPVTHAERLTRDLLAFLA